MQAPFFKVTKSKQDNAHFRYTVAEAGTKEIKLEKRRPLVIFSPILLWSIDVSGTGEFFSTDRRPSENGKPLKSLQIT